MKEQQFTEEKPLLPEQRGVDSDMVSPPGLFFYFEGTALEVSEMFALIMAYN